MKPGPRTHPPEYYHERYPEIVKLRKRGYTYEDIGRRFKPVMCRQAVHYICKRAGLTDGMKKRAA